MKKQLNTLAFVCLTSFAFSQSGAKWATGGNASGAGDFLGTTNSFPIDFKTNNVLRATLSATGVFKINNLAGTGSRLIMADANGNLISMPQGTNNQVLLGNGTWGTLPVVPSPIWQTSSAGTYYNGKVGIGTTNPIVALDVVGDGRVSGNLFVGGGIVISDKINAITEIKGFDFKVDNDLTVQANSQFIGNTNLNNATVNGIFTTKTVKVGLNTASFELKTFPASPTNPTILAFLPSSASGAATASSIYKKGLCNTFNFTTVNSFSELVQVYGLPDPTSGTTGVVSVGVNGGDGIISYEQSTTGPTSGNERLLLNPVCNNDIVMCMGGGFPNAFKNFEIGEVAHNNGNALNINTRVGITKAISINDPQLTIPNKEVFYVGRNGKTVIGTQRLNVGPHTDAMLTVDGKILAKSCYVTLNNWADYVFANDYKVPNLYDVETYYKANKHLPEIPSEKEIIENGIDVAEMNKLLLKKIEEITILMVQQQKDIDALKAKGK